MKQPRRDFLKTAGAVSAAGLLTPAISTAEEVKENNHGITRQTLAEAEKLTGVPYTDPERDQIIEIVEQQLELVQQLRALAMKNAGPAPSMVFDPRLPETVIPKAKWKRRRMRKVPPLPTSEEDIAFAPVTLLSEWIRKQQISSRELTEIYLRRIEKYAGKLECIVTVTRELALQQAAQADREISKGQYRGPLHGIPYGAKDLFDTKGIRTTWGAMPYKDRVAEQDATIVELLREAGAVLIAKTTLGALAQGDLWFDGVTRNPWNTEEGSGGSSAGSGSGVAAGLMGFAIGTETLGSIENPSTRNGIAGLRPTFGRVSRYGAMVLSWSMDKIGPMCRSVEDTMLVLEVLNGYDARDASSIEAPLSFDNTASVKGMRIGYVPKWFEGEKVDPVQKAVLDRISDLGMKLVEIKLPDLPYRSMRLILTAEATASLEELTLSDRDDLLRNQTVRARPNTMRRGRFISAVDFIQADRLRQRSMEVMHRIYEDVDCVIGPSISIPGGGTPMTVITNMTGHPSLTIRVGFSQYAARRSSFVEPKFYGAPASGKKKTVPESVTLWGPLFEDGKLCQIGMALEKILNVHHLRPSLST